MDLQELQMMLQELLQAVQIAIDSGEVLSDEVQGAVAKTLEILYNQIESLTNQSSADQLPPESPTQPNIESGMPSSNVEGFAYDDKTNRLYVRFLGQYPDRNGPVYAYEGVPKVIFDLFKHGSIPARTNGKNRWGRWWRGKVPSLGASLYSLIKTQAYPYQRLS